MRGEEEQEVPGRPPFVLATFKIIVTREVPNHPPPFFICDDAVLVFIHVLEELIQLGSRHGHPGFGESSFEFVFIDLAVMVPINALEHIPKSALRMVDKGPEFWGSLGG